MISIADCLILDSILNYFRRYSSWDDSRCCPVLLLIFLFLSYQIDICITLFTSFSCRFASGCYQTYGHRFEVHVRPQFLSPLVTYTVNLVFKCPNKEFRKKQYIAIKYELEGEIKISIGYLADKWLIARLYQFTNDRTTVNLKFNFQNTYCCLEIEGIEFHPVKNVSENFRFI